MSTFYITHMTETILKSFVVLLYWFTLLKLINLESTKIKNKKLMKLLKLFLLACLVLDFNQVCQGGLMIVWDFTGQDGLLDHLFQ